MKKDPFQALKDKLKGYTRLIALVLTFLLIVSLVRNIKKTLEAEGRIEKKQERVEELKAENEELKRRLESVTSDEFIERQLREKLGLVKEDEIIVVLPDEETLRALIPEPQEEEDTLPKPNWQKWLALFGI